MIDSNRLWGGWLWLLNRNFLYVLGVVAVWTFWDYVGEVLPSEFGVILLIYSAFGATIFPAVLTVRLLGPPSADLSVALGIALSRFWSLLGLAAISTIILLIGVMLLFIPGLVLGTFLSLAMCILLAENRPLLEAIRESVQRIKPIFWPVFGMLVIMVVASVGIYIVFQVVMPMLTEQRSASGIFLGAVLSNFVASMFVIWSVALYFEVQHIRTES